MKIENLDELLAQLPAEDRDAARAEITKTLEGLDPRNPEASGVVPVRMLTQDESGKPCPDCGGKLDKLDLVFSSGELDPMDMFECDICGASFNAPATN